ncbi:MAG: multidrug transporter subunit MdtA [Rhodocyclales bacterium]|nr:multidrug transporter subunit MdtA [Rhodocyclales bacterium]
MQVGNVRQGELRIYFASLGTVTPANSVIVHARLDGQLNRLDFKEGQMVRAGQLLAEIDRAPLLVEVAQAEGQLARDQAQLQNARRDLARYQTLLAQDSISRQQVDTAEAQVRQYEGVIKSDQAQVDSTKLQLSYTRIVAPVSGRLGLRQVDAGNMIHTSDANGIVSINQVQPISVVFTLPESQLPAVLGPLHDNRTLRAEAWDRGQKQMLADGRVVSLDNQIDLTTGTVKLKASFANEDGTLFPNQFVNVRVLAETRPNAIIAPSAAIQRGRTGTFVYLVKADNSVTQRPVTTGATEGSGTEITQGLQAGDIVVIDGVDQLREGAKVEVANAASLLKERPRGAGRGGRGRRGGDASAPLAESQSGPQGDRPRGPGKRPDAGSTDSAPAGDRAQWQQRRQNADGMRQGGQSVPQAERGPRPDWANGERPYRRRGDGAASSPASN